MLKKIFLMTCLSIPFSVAFGDAYADKQEAKFLKKAPEDVRQAIKKSNDLNDKCRGGSSSSYKTMEACEERSRVMGILESTGWCWGSTLQNAAGYQLHWLPCEFKKS
jgi:hypothetical protein